MSFWNWFDEVAAPKLAKAPPQMQRLKTFRQMCEYLDTFPKGEVCIIETGTMAHDPEDWDLAWALSGCSTIIFDKYVELNRGHFFSVDTNKDRVVAARKMVGKNTQIVHGDSVTFLKRFGKVNPWFKPDLVYLDASDLYWHNPLEMQIHHYNELKAIMPRLHPRSMVAVDDSPPLNDEFHNFEIYGKGKLVAQYARDHAIDLQFSMYQSGWVGFPGDGAEKTPEALDEILMRARAHMEAGRWVQAHDLYKTILQRTPPAPPMTGIERIMRSEAYLFFARKAVKLTQLGTALDFYRAAIDVDPRMTDERIEMIRRAMLPLGAMNAGESEAVKVAHLSGSAQAWKLVGDINADLNRPEKVIEAYDLAVQVSNNGTAAMLDRVIIAMDTADYETAGKLLDELLARGERLADVHHCLGMFNARAGRHEEGIEHYNKAIELKCADVSQAQFNQSLSYHSIGKYKEGFDLHRECRPKAAFNPALQMPVRRFVRPLFDMQEPPGTLHLHAEAGAGDNICMFRYIPLLLEKGYVVRYEALDDMVGLARDNFPEIEVMPLASDYPGSIGLDDFDWHCPMGWLPVVFNTDIDSVPWYGPYIKPNPALVTEYAKKLDALYSRDFYRVGIAWSSGIRDGIWLKRYGLLKSMHFSKLEPILALNNERSNVRFVPLQVGPERAENTSLADVLPVKPSWLETAALVANLDLVITVDTGLAHLCGAMGAHTWLMMHGHNQGWHFMTERPGAKWNTKSPWYPSIRLFRQATNSHDWTHVVGNIAQELQYAAKLAA